MIRRLIACIGIGLLAAFFGVHAHAAITGATPKLVPFLLYWLMLSVISFLLTRKE